MLPVILFCVPGNPEQFPILRVAFIIYDHGERQHVIVGGKLSAYFGEGLDEFLNDLERAQRRSGVSPL